MKKIVLAIMLVLGFGLTNVSANDNTPEGVILAFAEALKNKQVEKAISMMSKKEFTRLHRPTKKMYDSRREKVEEEIGGLYSYAVPNPSAWEFKAKCNNNQYGGINCYFEKRNKYNQERNYKDWGYGNAVAVVKENGIWKISTFV